MRAWTALQAEMMCKHLNACTSELRFKKHKGLMTQHASQQFMMRENVFSSDDKKAPISSNKRQD